MSDAPMRFPIFYRQLTGLVYAVLLAALLTLVGLSRFVDWESVARHGVARNVDWLPLTRTFDNGLAMALVPAGCFMMGEDESGTERCFDAPFWIGQHEITDAQYQGCVAAGACTSNRAYRGFDDPQLPVVGVDWFQARDYATWIGGRLPTEAEWEYAARGPDSLAYPWGDAFDGGRLNFCDVNCAYAWQEVSSDDGYAITSPVGAYPKGVSWVGALDMSGNVWEWTVPQDDSRTSGVLRGGSWSYYAGYARPAARLEASPDVGVNRYGFRVCCLEP